MKISGIFPLFIILILSFTFQIVSAEDLTIYKTDFSDDSGWVTNSPGSYSLDNSSGRLSYHIEGGTGSYITYPLKQSISSAFILEFDVYPKKTDTGATFRFGLGNKESDSQSGPLVMFELARESDDAFFYVVVISNENLRTFIVSSPGKSSYGGNTANFEDGKEYHVKLTWYPVDKRIAVNVRDKSNNEIVFSHFVQVTGKLEELSHLFLTAIGDGITGPKASGYIDNIVLTIPSNIPTSEETEEPTPTEIIPIPTLVKSVDPTMLDDDTEDVEVKAERTLLPPPPEPTPTQKSPIGMLPFILLTIGIIMSVKIKRR